MRATVVLLGLLLVLQSTLPISAQESDDLKAIRKMLEAQSLEIQEVRKQIQLLHELLVPQQPASSVPSAPESADQPPNTSLPPTTHAVTKGETLTSIARKHKVSVTELLNANKITDERKLQIGQTLVLPQQTTETPKPTE